MIAIKGITLGFILHLIIRSLWVALVSLSSVFVEGKDLNRIKLAHPYSVIDVNALNNFILRLDKIAGLAIFYAILFVFIVIGFWVHIGTLLFIGISVLGEGNFSILEGFMIYSFLIYWADLFLFGIFRKIPYLSYVTYPIFKVYDVLAFRWIYGSSIELISSRVKRWKIFTYMTGFIFLTLIFSYINLYRIMHWPFLFDRRENIWEMAPESPFSDHHYLDNYQEGFYPTRFAIPSEIIKDGFLELHVIYRKEYDDFMKNLPANNHYLSALFEISIDSNVIHNVDWHAWYPDKRDQFGIKTFIDVDTLSRGKHELMIRNKYVDKNNEQEERDYPDRVVILFWKD